MKTSVFIFILSFSMNLYAVELICKSDDFNPENYEGQSLALELNQSGTITKISKMTGSWFCDQGQISNPTIIAENADTLTYDADFKCDEWDAQLVVTKISMIDSKVTYKFTWSDDESDKIYESELFCY